MQLKNSSLTVPEYEIVEIFHDENFHRSRKTRSASTQLQLQAFGKNLTLYLEPNDHVLLDKDTPVFGATKDYSQPFGVKYTRLENVSIASRTFTFIIDNHNST